MIGPDGLISGERRAWRALMLAAAAAAENKGAATAQEYRRQAAGCRSIPFPQRAGGLELEPAVLGEFRDLLRLGAEWALLSPGARSFAAASVISLAQRCGAWLAPEPPAATARSSSYLARKDIFG